MRAAKTDRNEKARVPASGSMLVQGPGSVLWVYPRGDFIPDLRTMCPGGYGRSPSVSHLEPILDAALALPSQFSHAEVQPDTRKSNTYRRVEVHSKSECANALWIVFIRISWLIASRAGVTIDMRRAR